MEIRLDAGGLPDLPPIDPAVIHLVDWLFDAGPMSASGAGPVRLTWADLEAWQRGSGISLQPWQGRLLRALSGEYLAESRGADEHDAPPPWTRHADRERVAQHIKGLLRG